MKIFLCTFIKQTLKTNINTMSKEAEEYYNNLEVKKPFTKLTSTGIDDNKENVFELMQSYAEQYHNSRVEAVTDEKIEYYVLEFIDKHGMKEGLELNLENTVVGAGGVLNMIDWLKNELLKNIEYE